MPKYGPANTAATECIHGKSFHVPCADCGQPVSQTSRTRAERQARRDAREFTERVIENGLARLTLMEFWAGHGYVQNGRGKFIAHLNTWKSVKDA